ncbi:putative TTDN1/Protein SICKLE [Helianthus anomalus]
MFTSPSLQPHINQLPNPQMQQPHVSVFLARKPTSPVVQDMGEGEAVGQDRVEGEGEGGHNHASAEEQRPDCFFNKSMLEDPWKFLEPVIWKSLKKQWLSPSLNAKKPRVSESQRQSSSQPSPAEIFAASFNEAAEDVPDAE